jgi:glucosamine-6-phosphate deaminase
VDIYDVKSAEQLKGAINEILTVLIMSYEGQKNSPRIQQLKGMIREFEEELVWAHFGVQVRNVHHLRLGFYTGGIFAEEPEEKRDVEPVYKMIKDIKPTVISLAMDPKAVDPTLITKCCRPLPKHLEK